MAEEDQDQKTEQPTGKRLDEARSRGQLPISREMTSLVSIVGILIVAKWLAPGMATQLMSSLRVFLESPHAFQIDDHGLQTLALDTVVQMLLAVGLIFTILAFLTVAGHVLQTGLFASTELLIPNLSRLSLLAGIKRLISVNSLVELVKSFGKLVVLGTVAFFTLWPIVPNLPGFTGKPLMDSVAFMHDRAVHLILVLMLVFGVIAIGDLFYQRYAYIKNLKMTKTEVKDEYKQQEGDPVVKGRIRQLRLEKARKRMMAQVPRADVVITNPTHYAVALKYDSSKSSAPVVLAKGIDRIAERIREIAEENKIALVSNPPLARTLYDTVELDKEIPTNLYRAVAEVISYVYKLKKKKI